MNLYVPRPGESIRLTQDWEFTLHSEDRNETLIRFLGHDYQRHWGPSTPLCTAKIPAGSVLKIDRVYIRKGMPDWDSITFHWKGRKLAARTEEVFGRMTKIPAKTVRFWVKLDETRTIEFEPV